LERGTPMSGVAGAASEGMRLCHMGSAGTIWTLVLDTEVCMVE
jgi:hypothetical protein